MSQDLPDSWLAAYPGTRFDPVRRLLIWHPRGPFNRMRGEAFLNWMEAVEPRLGAFDRFADLSDFREIHLSAEDIASFAQRRRERYSGEPVTTVLFANTPLSYGIAAIYERLMVGTPIRVRPVVMLASACRILRVAPDILGNREG